MKTLTHKIADLIFKNEGWKHRYTDAYNLANMKILELPELKAIQMQAEVKPACFDWRKERPTKPCVFMTRVWNKNLGIYDYNIWRFEKIDCDGGWYLGWLTEGGEEWDDINGCNFDEYCIIESKSV